MKKRKSKTNPVLRAVVTEGMRKTLADIAIKAHLTPDGEVDRVLIAEFAFVIGLGAEVAIAMQDEQRARRLHSALRTLLGMSVNGGRWQAAQSARMYELACEANKLAIDNVDLALSRYEGARDFSNAIASGKARMDAVASVEIYAQAA